MSATDDRETTDRQTDHAKKWVAIDEIACAKAILPKNERTIGYLFI